MAVPTAYLISIKNVPGILDAVQKAGVPQRFTYEFLKQLGFGSSGDRSIIPVLKALRFLDDSGIPTDRYRRYKDPSEAKRVLAEALRDAYSDLFAIDQGAHRKSPNDLKGMFGRLSDKGESVTAKMATTFKALAERADFEGPRAQVVEEQPSPHAPSAEEETVGARVDQRNLAVHHDVHIHLPPTTDINVYHAIFRSLRENLL